MIERALKRQLDKKGISTYKLAKETGIKYELLRRVFKGARKLNITESGYNLIESGTRQKDLNLSLVQKLSEIFKIPINKIVEEEAKIREG